MIKRSILSKLPFYIGILPALFACTSVPKVELSPFEVLQLWMQRQSELVGIKSWGLKGRVSLTTKEDHWSATIHWQLQPEMYDIRFMNTLGQTQAELHADPFSATLRLPEQTVVADDATQLLEKHLGWTVPIDGLRYWVLGLPEPNTDADKKLEGRGRIALLEQSGWHIEYKKYTDEAEVDLPEKVVFTHPEIKLKLVVDEWQLESAQP